jgi:hypothetical protein
MGETVLERLYIIVPKAIEFTEAFMKTGRSKRVLTAGMAALLLSFALVLTGCPMVVDNDEDGDRGLNDLSIMIEGDANVGRTLTATVTGGSSALGIQWLRVNNDDQTGSIVGTGDAYLIQPEDEGSFIRARVLTGSGKSPKYVYSEATGIVKPAPVDEPGDNPGDGGDDPGGDGGDNPGDDTDPEDGASPAGTVIVIGTAHVGDTLRANTDEIGGTGRITYWWERSDTPDDGFERIFGATSVTYTLLQGDAGKYFRVKVISAGDDIERTSKPVGPVALLPTADSITVSGNANVGETLTVSAVLNGNGTPAYRWERLNMASEGVDWTPIADAVSSSYTLRPEDQGTYVRAAVSRAGGGDEKIAEPVGPVDFALLTGTVLLSGTARIGEAVTATPILDGSGAVTYKWQRSDTLNGGFTDISGAASVKYTLVAADRGKYIRAAVSRMGYSGAIPSAVMGPIELPLLTGSVTMSGEALVGQRLTANTAALGGSGAITYKWQRSNTANGTFTDIAGAASAATYTVAATDVGKYMRVAVSRAGYDGTIAGAAAGPVGNTLLTGSVTMGGLVDGKPVVGQPLTANTAALGGSGTIIYQWQRLDEASGTFTDISGAGFNSYTPVQTDVGKYIRVTVSRDGYGGTKSSTAVGPVKFPALGGSITLSGKANVGETLTANTGVLLGSIVYQWQRFDTASGTFTNISGAVSVTYIPVQADLGKYIRVAVSREGYDGTMFSATAAPVGLPLLTGRVAITGNVTVGQTLAANTSALGGSGIITYQWQRSDPVNGPWVDIPGATAAAYTLVEADNGKTIRLDVGRTGYEGVKWTTAGPVR